MDPEDLRSQRGRLLFKPILAPLLGNRLLLFGLGGGAVIQIGLTALLLPSWHCPIQSVLWLPCPGCGLSQAIVLLLQGDWHSAVSIHAFAPVFLTGVMLIVTASLLPVPLHQKVVRGIEKLESAARLVPMIIMSMGIYWVFRILK